MTKASDISPPRRRFRKLRLAFVAFGLIFVASLLLLALAGRDERQGVRVRLDHVSTDREQNVFLWFALTNTEPQAVIVSGLALDVKMNGQWLALGRETDGNLLLPPGQSTNLVRIGSRYATAYRGELLWHDDLTAFQRFRLRVKNATRAIMRGPNSCESTIRVIRWKSNKLDECYP